VHELRRDYPIEGLLKQAALPRSTFYYQQKKLHATDKYAALKIKIKEIYHGHKGRYGYRRVTAALRRLGHVVNHKLIQRLMGILGLKSLVRPKKYRSYKGEIGAIAPNVLKRQFKATSLNQKWVTDVTEFRVAGEKLYLSPIMDLFNREIIAYKTSKKPVQIVDEMLHQAVRRLRRKDKPVLHSDQGWQYPMRSYQRVLRNHGVVQSMSRKGNCLDNAAMESFFGTLKAEFFHLQRFKSIDELRKGLKGYIEYYNRDRITLKLKGLSPVEYRTQPLYSS
jgi:transposase InsO family protein